MLTALMVLVLFSNSIIIVCVKMYYFECVLSLSVYNMHFHIVFMGTHTHEQSRV